jgi:long-chain acyl-CoA synthetase
VNLADRVAEVMQLEPAAPAVWDNGRWWTWQDVDALRRAIEARLGDPGPGDPGSGGPGPGGGLPVGLLARTRFGPVAAVLSLIAGRRTIVPFNPMLGDATLADDIRRTPVALILAEADDWSRPAVRAAAGDRATTLTPAGRQPLTPLAPVTPLAPRAAPTPRAAPADGSGPELAGASPDIAVWMLTSGTTGPPKRIPIRFGELDHMLDAVGHYSESGRRAQSAKALGSRPVIMASPLVHSSGFGGILRAVAEGRPIALLERFSAPEWSLLVQRFEPAAAALVPAALRMILDAGIPAERLRSLRAITVGTAPLDSALADEFEAAYAVPLLPNYGATEFPGGLTGWTMASRRQHWQAKRGSVGTAHPGVDLRVRDAASGQDLDPGAVGLLTVRTPETAGRSADGWVVTNDLASIDRDGFVYIHGRADEAIIRGGFKIVPREIEKLLESHPAVRAAGVVGRPDQRLGSVPVAAVEADGEITPADLLAWLRERLPSYQVPVEVKIVPQLPRTPSMKISKPGVGELFAH